MMLMNNRKKVVNVDSGCLRNIVGVEVMLMNNRTTLSDASC